MKPVELKLFTKRIMLQFIQPNMHLKGLVDGCDSSSKDLLCSWYKFSYVFFFLNALYKNESNVLQTSIIGIYSKFSCMLNSWLTGENYNLIDHAFKLLFLLIDFMFRLAMTMHWVFRFL